MQLPEAILCQTDQIALTWAMAGRGGRMASLQKKKEGKKWKQTKEEEEEGKKRKPVKNFFVIELKFHWIKCQLPAAAFVFG